jgi:hypothetical protein
MLASLHAEVGFQGQRADLFPVMGGCLEHSLSAGIILLSGRGVDHSACCEWNFLFKLPKTVGLQPFYQKSGRKFRLPLMAHRRRIPEK